MNVRRCPLEHFNIKRMIKFRSIRWRNFLSTGNNPTEIDLSGPSNCLIVGENGSGKSTILDALTFALFGKPFRNINKPQLVNTVNEKDCLAEVVFEANGKTYRVARGLKPSLFEIYINGVLLDQAAHTADYQEHLENNILKMNHKSFTQIDILGSASFTPFMQLKPADRRSIIENLLDIQIFSTMNVLTKQRLQNNKESVEKLRIRQTALEDKKQLLEHTISSLQSNNQEQRQTFIDKIAHYNSLINQTENEIGPLRFYLNNISDDPNSIPNLRTKHRKLISLQSKIESNFDRANTEIEFFEHNDTCPTCTQTIQDDFKQGKVDIILAKKVTYEEGLAKIYNEIQECIADIDEFEQRIKLVQSKTILLDQKRTQIDHFKSQIEEVGKDIARLSNSDTLLNENILELEVTTCELNTVTSEKDTLLEERKYIELSLGVLKDGGIKTRIIKQYLPIINQHINKFLSQMGFFVNFNINEQFEETIKSRFRDIFSYSNFSEGEKMKIDMALLLTWRAIAKIKNSAATNLLICDEIFDSSLDSNGIDAIMNILKSLYKDTNIFVISHRGDTIQDKFGKIIRFEKVGNFSRMY